MAENVPNLKKETDIQAQETQKVPNKVNLNRPTQGKACFSTEAPQAGRERQDVLKVLKGKSPPPETLYWNQEFPKQLKTKTIQHY